MEFKIQGFNSYTNTYDNLDMNYGNFDKILAIKVRLETDKLEEVKEKFKQFSESCETFKCMMNNEEFNDSSIQIYKELENVYMVYCGNRCEDAYNSIIQFMNLIEL